jgi:hypothetical protein
MLLRQRHSHPFFPAPDTFATAASVNPIIARLIHLIFNSIARVAARVPQLFTFSDSLKTSKRITKHFLSFFHDSRPLLAHSFLNFLISRNIDSLNSFFLSLVFELRSEFSIFNSGDLSISDNPFFSFKISFSFQPYLFDI